MRPKMDRTRGIFYRQESETFTNSVSHLKKVMAEASLYMYNCNSSEGKK